MKPTAWKLESAPGPDGKRIVRDVWTTEPTEHERLICEVDGERFVPMVELPEAEAAVQAAR